MVIYKSLGSWGDTNQQLLYSYKYKVQARGARCKFIAWGNGEIHAQIHISFFLSFFLFFFFLAAPMACGNFQARDQTVSQQWPKPLQWQCWILNPLCHKRNSQRHISEEAFYWDGEWGHMIRENSTGRKLCQKYSENPTSPALSHFILSQITVGPGSLLLRTNGLALYLCFLGCQIKVLA